MVAAVKALRCQPSLAPMPRAMSWWLLMIGVRGSLFVPAGAVGAASVGRFVGLSLQDERTVDELAAVIRTPTRSLTHR